MEHGRSFDDIYSLENKNRYDSAYYRSYKEINSLISLLNYNTVAHCGIIVQLKGAFYVKTKNY